METKLVDPKLRPIAIKYILGMLEDTINPTFNFLLKYFHLLLVEKTINPQYDMIIWDELQDTSEVALEIFKELQTPYKIGLGDTDQSIYGFLNLVNGFELLHNNAQILPLTKSFRCSKDISERIEQFGKDWLNPKFTFTGTEETEADGKKAYITATNAAIIERISILHNRNEGYVLTRPLKEIFAATLALITANNGKEVLHNQYKFLNVEYKNYTLSNYNTFFEYLRKEVKDEEINSSIDLIFTLAAQKINVFNVLSTAKIIKKNKDILVSTFFSCKGLGFESVHIADDLNALCIKAQKLIMENKAKAEDHVYIKGYYVACSRAKLFLHNANI
jgi:superfamily I DNA/RNA helicase